MKIFSIYLFLFITVIAKAGNCNNEILIDPFSSSAGWTSQGNGAVNISDGQCNFDHVYDGDYNRIYKNLGVTLSDHYWKAECTFSILSFNPQGNGSDATVMALTAGNLNFMTDNGVESNQDGIAATFGSANPAGNNFNNWYFTIQGKKGNVRTSGVSLFALSSITQYYIKLERTSAGTTQLSVFSDATFTTHIPGSPITFKIDSTITGLNTVQHGVNAGGTSSRLINATIDNDFICEDKNINECGMAIYPNPAANYLIIQNKSNLITPYDLKIVNTLGQVLLSESLEITDTYHLDVSNFVSGIYFIKLRNDCMETLQKIILQQ